MGAEALTVTPKLQRQSLIKRDDFSILPDFSQFPTALHDFSQLPTTIHNSTKFPTCTA
jgi:hypothetical protein